MDEGETESLSPLELALDAWFLMVCSIFVFRECVLCVCTAISWPWFDPTDFARFSVAFSTAAVVLHRRWSVTPYFPLSHRCAGSRRHTSYTQARAKTTQTWPTRADSRGLMIVTSYFTVFGLSLSFRVPFNTDATNLHRRHDCDMLIV